MTEACIHSFSKRTPDGEIVKWFEVVAIIAGREKRSSDHTYKTEADARAAAAAQYDKVDPDLYFKEL